MASNVEKREFWKSAGLHLLERREDGWLGITPQFLCAYFTRPEIHPIETSCTEEVRLFEELMADPSLPVGQSRLSVLADSDAADNYRIVLAFRDALLAAGSIEAAYLDLVRNPPGWLPPVFLEQLVHVILRNALSEVADPLRLRAAELFFREQSVSKVDGRLMLADQEIVEMHAATERETGLGQLLASTDTPMRKVALDVLDETNKELYWQRSDRFDTVIDFRVGQPTVDAFARVVETWLRHLMRLDVHVQPVAEITDPDWRWHIGLDAEATGILNALYTGEQPGSETMERIVALFRMRFAQNALLIDRVQGRPVYLGLAMTESARIRMKPHNLLANLPLRAAS
jgi:hypothetical protein